MTFSIGPFSEFPWATDVTNPFSQSRNINFTTTYGKAYPQSLRTWTQSPFIGNIPAFVAPPFHQTDWPNPKAPPYAISLRTWANTPNIGTIPPYIPPFRQTDWPNPRSPQRTNLVTGNQSLNLSTLPVPFAQYDWPLPKTALRPKDIWQHRSLVLTALASPIGMANVTRPITAFFPQYLRTWTQNLLETTLKPAGVPFAFMGWTLPIRAKQPLRIDYQQFSFPLNHPFVPPPSPPDCGHLYPSTIQLASLTEAFYTAGILNQAISVAGDQRSAISKAGSTRSSASKAGSMKPTIPC